MFAKALKKVINGDDLNQELMIHCMEKMMEGKIHDNQIASLLTALKMKGESVTELTAGAKVLRKKALTISDIPTDTLDTCGTGGDGSGTFNISTAVALLSAAAGLKVLKHGNRSFSSLCGSADVLEALGVRIDLSPEETAMCLKQTNFGFLLAPLYHKAVKNVMPVRKALGFRTIFNLLGPLVNPGGAKYQLLGVYDENLTEVMAEVLRALGVDRALVVHGKEGLDEISITGSTIISELKEGYISSYEIHPEDFGIPLGRSGDITGGNAKKNGQIIKDIFQGKLGAARDILLMNAGAALYVGEKVSSMSEGIDVARKCIDEGLAYKKLQEIIQVSGGVTS
ncbi:anthranilate phosphoribosyltransferase [Vallitalea okinawensis]|uniref:anthranilate phosphoribosyltransferase n=1 Tax=Vallitalea okinawensis TaxID=2078660 RepID=UPI000CFDF2B8|nr:anthranilate phosphoribosyltransferase [Vallitalea okinawensis]